MPSRESSSARMTSIIAMAVSTLARVAAPTYPRAFATRDTVCPETPARRATSSNEGSRLRTGGTGSTIAFSKLKDEVWSGAVDFGYAFSTARPLALSAGYAYTDNSRTSSRRDFRYQSADALADGVSQQRPDYLLSPFNIQAYDQVERLLFAHA